MTTIENKTLSQIVTENYQAARVFEKYGLDFCCKGKRPLEEACAEKGIKAEDVWTELRDVFQLSEVSKGGSDVNNMSLTELAEYIVRVHHTYVKLNLPQIFNYVLRVATKHGDRFPFMKEVYLLFAEVREEMTQHMLKEEQILFPRIKLMELNAAQGKDVSWLQAPIDVMEDEHDKAGSLLYRIRELTNNYTAPEGACTTFHLSLDALKGFEEDLHRHVHLENNILFPKAVAFFNEKCNTVPLN
jgi:regulator of cell morphogenesis and NO signaling